MFVAADGQVTIRLSRRFDLYIYWHPMQWRFDRGERFSLNPHRRIGNKKVLYRQWTALVIGVRRFTNRGLRICERYQ